MSRLSALRAVMKRKGLSAFIIPSTDPHISEYVTPHWMSREWISGFTGSAGTVVVTHEEAGLWTDSRYFLQAAAQLQGSGIELYKEALPETPSITAFLKSRLTAGEVVGIDGLMFPLAQVEQMQAELQTGAIELRSVDDPMEEIWSNRPALPDGKAFVHELKYAGRSVADKLSDIRSRLQDMGTESLLLAALDEIAWTLNLRGQDVHCNPVVIGYLIVDLHSAHFFINAEKLTPEVSAHLAESGVCTHEYTDITRFLASYHAASMLIDPTKTNYSLCAALNPDVRVMRAASPVALLKAVRNATEIEGLHRAMHRDGLAMVRLLKWLDETVPTGSVTEVGVDRKQHELRAEQPLYVGESFDTIAGYAAHGAIVHYEPTPETDITVEPRGLLLIDSGAQYLDGTTDITRTVAVGPLTDEEKEDYTLILKCHIGLTTAVFPEGTRGDQLDVLARMPIWKRRMNFLHGTGHGVGAFLNVHEGPQSVRMNHNPITLLAGMTITDEPGVYKTDKHGVRTENVELVVPAGEGMFGRYLQFEAVTLCPIDTRPIVVSMLNKEEIDWLNDYHERVYRELSPDLDEAERNWLAKACETINN